MDKKYSDSETARKNTAKMLADRFCQIYNGDRTVNPPEKKETDLKKYTKNEPN